MLCYEYLSRIASSVLRVNCYQRGSCVGGPSAFNFPFGHGESLTQHPPTRQPPLWFIHIALKLGAQLSISTAIFWVGVYKSPIHFVILITRSAEYIDYHFSSLWYDSAVNRTHNLSFWWRALYHYTTSRYSNDISNSRYSELLLTRERSRTLVNSNDSLDRLFR